MSKPVAEKGEGRARNYEVYGIIQNMMKEGSANFFKDSRRYRVDWVKALEYYKAYRQRKDPRFNIPRRKLSKDLRSALLSSSYANDGAKEYPSSKKVNNVQEVVERQFQMPFKVFKSLFGNAECSDISEEQDEQGAGKAGSSTDTGYDDNMNITDGPSEPVDLRSLDDPANFETNVPGTYNQDFSFEIQMEDLGDSILKDICSEPEEILETIQGACEIVPVSGPVEGGYPFVISYTERLPDNVSSGMAEFEGVKKVKLKRRNSYTFAGRVPASHQTGRVGVKVTSQCGVWLGRTFFCYVEMEKKRKQLVRDLAQLSSFLSDMSQKYGSFAVDSDIALVPDPPNLQFQGDLDSTIQATQKQSIKILELLVYTAAQTGAKQFIEMIFSTSAQRTVFDSYKDRAQLPEDVARANGHCSLAQYLEDITTRLTKEADDKPKAIDWLELLKAVQNQVSVSQDKESKEETSSVESDYNSSDYFADTETSSCGSSEDDDVFTSNSEGKDVVEKGESKERLLEDPPYSSTQGTNHLVDSKPPDNEKQNGSSFLEVIHDDVDESFVSGVCVDGAVSRDRYKKKITDVHFPEEENNKHLVTAENAAVKTNNDTASVCHLRKENHRQDLVPKKVYRTCQDPGMHPLPPTLWPCRADSPTGVSKERLLEDPPYSSIPDANHMEDSKPPDEKQSGSSFLGFFLREDLYFNPVFPSIKKTPLIDLNFNRVLSSIKKTPLIGWIDNSLGFSFGICLSIAEMKAIARKVCGRCCSIVEMKEIAREIFDTVHITVGNSAQFLGGSPSKWINCRELSRYESKQEKRVLMAENVVVSASTCRLKRPGYLVLSPLEADERQLHQEQFIFEKSIDFINNAPPQTDSSASLHGVSSGNVSWKNESSIKELKMARVRSWLSCNPNSEEFPSAEGF